MGGLIPLGDASRRNAFAPLATLLIILANAFVFLQELAGGDDFVARWSTIPAVVFSGHRAITLLTGMFLHASWMHIIGNMIFLWAFGPEIEGAMGRMRYLVFYLAGGLIAMLAQALADPESTIPCLGASGAIAAVMGAFLVTFPGDRIRTVLFFLIFFRITYIPAIFLIGFWFLTQLLNAGAVSNLRMGGVAYLAHLDGFVFGAVTGRFFVDPRRVGRKIRFPRFRT